MSKKTWGWIGLLAGAGAVALGLFGLLHKPSEHEVDFYADDEYTDTIEEDDAE